MNKTSLYNISSKYNSGVAFRSNETATTTISSENKLVRTQTKDNIELSTKKKTKKIHPLVKYAVGITAVAGTVICSAYLVSRHQTKHLKKLYDEKLIMSNLPENIVFKEAKTLEEAMDFAKNILKIKNVDKNFSLEALNVTNRGLVDVSNANKGKSYLPTTLTYIKPQKDTAIASVYNDIKSNKFGTLNINPKYFDNKELDKIIEKNLFSKDNLKLFIKKRNSETYQSLLLFNFQKINTDNELSQLIEKFYSNKATMTLSEKKLLAHSLTENYKKNSRYKYSPISFLEEISSKYQTVLEQHNIKIDFKTLKSKNKKEQIKEVENILQKISNEEDMITQTYSIHRPETTIYHEMGHLQDFGKNLKDLDVKQNQFTLKGFWEDLKKEFKGESNNINLRPLFDNRWGGITYNGFEELLKKNPDKFKQLYPDLYEFLTTPEIQETAGKISKYSQSSIGEFIAETYVKMINKEYIPDDVMKLYKKYNGPLLPN